MEQVTLTDRDHKYSQPTNPKAAKQILQLMNENELVDIWCEDHPEQRMFTWQRSKPKLIFKRLDYIIVSKSVQRTHTQSRIIPAFNTDHSFPEMCIKTMVQKKGPGYWKMNTTYLELEEYDQEISNILNNYFNQNEEVELKWDIAKMEIRGYSIRFGTRKKKSTKQLIEVLNKKLNYLQNRLVNEQCECTTGSITAQIALLQKDLAELVEKSTNFARQKCAQQWYEGGEKCTKYFMNIIEDRSKKKVVKALQTQNGIIHDQNKILKHIANYYKDLFTAQLQEINDKYLEDITFPEIEETEKAMLEQPITIQEVKIAIKQLKTGKCPGLDGIPIELYQKYSKQISTILHAIYIQSVDKSRLRGSLKQGTIALLDKPDKNLLQISNWRPLTMLSCDYKIFAKIVANRLSLVLPTIIHGDQKGFMKGRKITQNLLELSSIIEYCENNDIPAYVLSIDFRKAFDSVEWPALFHVMEKFNFGPKFIQLVKLCLQDFSTSVLNHGYRSEFFLVTRGLKQGCPLSSGLFNIIVETIAIKICQNHKIKGIVVNGIRKCLGQFADDLWTVSQYDEQSYTTTLHLFRQFEKYSGLKINYDKSEVLRVGSLRYSDAKFYSHLPLTWSDGPIKILGIEFTASIQQTTERNYEKLYNKIESIMCTWSSRELTILGKIQICNVKIISQMIYKLQVLPKMSKDLVKKIRAKIREFIWNSKPPKIKYAKLIKKYCEGGLQLHDFKMRDKALKASWIYQLEKLDPFLKAIAKQLISIKKLQQIEITNFNINPMEAKKDKTFWNNAFEAWCQFNYNKPISKENIMNQVVWNNSHCNGVFTPAFCYTITIAWMIAWTIAWTIAAFIPAFCYTILTAIMQAILVCLHVLNKALNQAHGCVIAFIVFASFCQHSTVIRRSLRYKAGNY